MIDSDCNLLTCWGGCAAGDAEVALAFKAMKAEGVTMFDPLLVARARPLLPPFVLGTPEARCTAFLCFSAIMHANPFIRNA